MNASSTQPLSKPLWQTLARLDTRAVLFLLALGIAHLPLQLVSEISWESAVSFRKPILFGISTGLTLGSLLWLLDDLIPKPSDRLLRTCLCLTLVFEVLLITAQSWRRVPSHFNRTTAVDTAIELAMLACILLAMGCILILTIRSLRPQAFRDVSSARILAQQTGMLFLAMSCFLGIGITVVGNYQLLTGGTTETFGARGVLKFPHGAVLHAIQTLVVWSSLCDRLSAARGKQSVAWLVGAHVVFLVYATRQTWLGKSRWESDGIAWLLLGFTILFSVLGLVLLLERFLPFDVARLFDRKR